MTSITVSAHRATLSTTNIDPAIIILDYKSNTVNLKTITECFAQQWFSRAAV